MRDEDVLTSFVQYFMKRLFLSGFFGLLLVSGAWGQTSAFYVNNGIVNEPPDIDAINFVNNGIFDLSSTFLSLPFDTSNTQNFTNRNSMRASIGFRFDTVPTPFGARRMAANFVNAGTVASGGVVSSNFFFFDTSFFSSLFFGGPKLFVSATNIVSPGTLSAGVDGLIRLEGKNVDLSRGTVREESNSGAFGFVEGIFDRYWGVGTTNFNLGFGYFNPPFVQTPSSQIVELQSGSSFLPYFTNYNSLSLSNAQSYVYTNQVTPTNLTIQVVFLSNTNPAIATDVTFINAGGGMAIPLVSWISRVTNEVTGIITTNSLFLEDDFGAFTNLYLFTNTFGINNGRPTLAPWNYTISTSPFFNFFFGASNNAVYSPGLLAGNSTVVTNDYSAYAVDITGTTTLLDTGVAGSSVTNMPGRVEIKADNQLDLTRTLIEAQNYLSLRATNHFVGSSNASITVPFSDISLGSTNGLLDIQNLLIPFVPRLTGTLDAWSGRWTNFVGAVEVRYHVLVVDSALAHVLPALINNLKLRSRQVVVSDTLNVSETLLVDAEQLTVKPDGQINILSSTIVWSDAMPRLQSFTNEGSIKTLNSVYFGGARRAPHYNTDFDEPYINFVNRGSIASEGTLIWANYFENSGGINSGAGPLTVRSLAGILRGGALAAPSADLSISSSSLIASNYLITTGRKLILNVSGLLTDGGILATNRWSVGDGMDLLVKPAAGDLLGTRLTNTAPVGAEVLNSWAGEDRGAVNAGYSNNGALGWLVLDGGKNSQFTFNTQTGSNALYVDYLELKNYATNIDEVLTVNPGMVIYFANSNVPVEKLESFKNGRIRWVSSYAGANSSTNMLYYNGQTYTFNIALVTSYQLDSDGDGVLNAEDAYPIDIGEYFRVNISLLTNSPPTTVVVSWNAYANTLNQLESKLPLLFSSWQTVTNFVQGPVPGPVNVHLPVAPDGARLYRVRVDPAP